jgi:hypothetical protein
MIACFIGRSSYSPLRAHALMAVRHSLAARVIDLTRTVCRLIDFKGSNREIPAQA